MNTEWKKSDEYKNLTCVISNLQQDLDRSNNEEERKKIARNLFNLKSARLNRIYEFTNNSLEAKLSRNGKKAQDIFKVHFDIIKARFAKDHQEITNWGALNGAQGSAD